MMNFKEFLQTKMGVGIELLLFFTLAISINSMFGSSFMLYAIAITSLGIRKIEWNNIGFSLKQFTLKSVLIGILVAILYFFTDQYLVNPIASKFAPAGLPEIFSIKGNVSKLIIGLVISWTVAAFFEEIVFRGYLIHRFIDLFGENLMSKISIVVLTGIAFGFVHAYQGLNGAISAAGIGALQAITFFIDKKKLRIPIIAHGTYDTIGFILLYIG